MGNGARQAASSLIRRSEVEVQCLKVWNAAASDYFTSVVLFDRIMAEDSKTLLAETAFCSAAAVYHTECGCFYLSEGTAQRVSNKEVRSALNGICYGDSMYGHWTMPGCGLSPDDNINDRNAWAQCEAEFNRMLALVAGDNE
jgi:hypothetical protein